MPTFLLLQVDAFTNTPLHGNPAAVVLDANGLTDAQMDDTVVYLFSWAM